MWAKVHKTSTHCQIVSAWKLKCLNFSCNFTNFLHFGVKNINISKKKNNLVKNITGLIHSNSFSLSWISKNWHTHIHTGLRLSADLGTAVLTHSPVSFSFLPSFLLTSLVYLSLVFPSASASCITLRQLGQKSQALGSAGDGDVCHNVGMEKYKNCQLMAV